MFRCIAIIAVPLLAITIPSIIQQFKPKVKKPVELNPQYDYIIIGGGTAGNVLAARLSEDEKTSVLLLEAGGEEGELFYSHMPGAAPFLQDTDFDWAYETEVQQHCCQLLNGKRLKWPRGKVLGGTSVLHLSHFVRGHPADFEVWHAASFLTNNTMITKTVDWTYRGGVEPYFKLLEAVDFGSVVSLTSSSAGRGSSGPIGLTENTKLRTTIGRDFIDALNSAGYKPMKDSALPEEGYGRPQFTIKNGKRMSTASAYLRPAMHRTNLHVVTRAKVNKITFNYNDEEKRAAGVEYEFHDSKHRVLTNREIILSAGTIGSPEILLSSGIGPKQYYGKESADNILHSSNEQILIQESPQVGQNLKDHVAFVLRYSINQPAGIDAKDALSLTGLIKSVFEYYLHGSGHLAYPPIEYIGFLNSKSLSKKDESTTTKFVAAPDVQFYFSPTDLLALNILNLTNFVTTTPNSERSADSKDTDHIFSLGFVLLKPQSSGEIKLKQNNADPHGSSSSVSIDPNYFSDESDFETLSKTVKHVHRLLIDSPSLAKYQLKILDSVVSSSDDDDDDQKKLFSSICGSSATNFQADAAAAADKDKDDASIMIDCLIKNRPSTAYHPTGTCRMGSTIEKGVVDAELKVHGVKGLRVVDASIFPEPVSSNPCATVIMVAEKAADLIKNDAKQFLRSS